jgi:hypothetical protein
MKCEYIFIILFFFKLELQEEAALKNTTTNSKISINFSSSVVL